MVSAEAHGNSLVHVGFDLNACDMHQGSDQFNCLNMRNGRRIRVISDEQTWRCQGNVGGQGEGGVTAVVEVQVLTEGKDFERVSAAMRAN